MSFSIPFRQAPFKKHTYPLHFTITLKKLLKSRNPSHWQGTAEWSTTTPYPCSLAFRVGGGIANHILSCLGMILVALSTSWWNCLFRRGIGGTEDRRCKNEYLTFMEWFLAFGVGWETSLWCPIQFSRSSHQWHSYLEVCWVYKSFYSTLHFQFHLQLKGTGRTLVLRTTQSMEESNTTQSRFFTNTFYIYTRFVCTVWYTLDTYVT